jgi:two-component system nitrate/nitrite response regulator NarL
MSNDIIRTAIVGGDLLFREGLRRILEDTRYRVDLIAPSLEAAATHQGRLDLTLLLGFSDRDPQFLDALADLCGKWPKAHVVAIGENRADQLIAALRAGVHGYLARYISAEALLRFLSLIVLGQRVFSTNSLDLPKDLGHGAIDEDLVQGTLAGRIESSALTARERELLAFLVDGCSNKVIARRLGIAEATVKAQMAKLFVKIGAANRTQAAVLAWASYRASPPGAARSPRRDELGAAR